MLNLFRSMEHIPVLMKAGAIIPMKDMRDYDNSMDNPKAMEVRIFPAKNGSFTLWEDAGDTPEDLDENWAATKLTFKNDSTAEFRIEKATGNLSVLPSSRTWKLVFTATAPATPVVAADGEVLSSKVSYDKESSCLIIEIPETDIEKEICITFPDGLALADQNLTDRCYRLLEKAQIEYNMKSRIYDIVKKQGADSTASLASLDLNPALLGALLEIINA